MVKSKCICIIKSKNEGRFWKFYWKAILSLKMPSKTFKLRKENREPLQKIPKIQILLLIRWFFSFYMSRASFLLIVSYELSIYNLSEIFEICFEQKLLNCAMGMNARLLIFYRLNVFSKLWKVIHFCTQMHSQGMQ